MGKIKFLQAKEKFNKLYKNKDFLAKSIVKSSGGGTNQYCPQR